MADFTKSTVAEANSIDEDTIVVTLLPRDSPELLQRRLVLTRKRPAIPIGRSSKVPDKGFNPAPDNAWFDNPVMSRQHAEIVARFEETPPAVYISDVASFHGTFHTPNDGLEREQPIAADKPVKMSNGDGLRFGTSIFRSDKTYPPCSVNFHMEETIQMPNKILRQGFTVPDYIDDDEDEDDIEIHDSTIANLNKRWIRSHAEIKNMIDLTIDDVDLPPNPSNSSPATYNTKSIIVDLTSERDEEAADCEPSLAVDSSAPRPPGIDTGSLPPVSPENGPSAEPGTNSNRTLRDLVGLFSSDSEDDEDMDSSSDIDIPNDDSNSELSDDTELQSDNMLTYEDDVLSQISTPSDMVDFDMEYYDSNVSRSGASSHDSSDDSSCSDDDEEDDGDATATLGTMRGLAGHGASSQPLGRSCDARPVSFDVHCRDPSPSDAALFKRRPILGHLSDASKAQRLGELSGKLEFFAAREKNRAATHQSNSTAPLLKAEAPVGVLQCCAGDDFGATTSQPQDIPSMPASRSSSSKALASSLIAKRKKQSRDDLDAESSGPFRFDADSTTNYSNWAGLESNHIPTLEERAGSPSVEHQPDVFDMTSAYKFQRSKVATSADANPLARRVPIQDLLAQDPKESCRSSPGIPDTASSNVECTKKKRSHGEAFNDAEQLISSKSEHEAPVPSSPDIVEVGDSDLPSTNNFESSAMPEKLDAGVTATADEGVWVSHEPTPVSAHQETSRPAKRARMATVAAQVVACVALGSAATFSYLINTAPVF